MLVERTLDRPYFGAFVGGGMDGPLAVTDTNNHRIVIFRDHVRGEILRAVGEGVLRCPMGIAAHPTLSMTAYVANMGSTTHGLIKLNLLDGHVIASAGSHGSAPGELRNPQGLAISGRYIFVSDTSNNRVCVFEDCAAEGLDFCYDFGSKGSQPGELFGPTGIAVLNRRQGCRHLFVCERYNHRVSKFTETGKLLLCMGGQRSSSPGMFNEPFGIAVLQSSKPHAQRPEADGGADSADTRLLVSEYFGRRIQLLSVNGVPLQTIAVQRPSQNPDSFGLAGVCMALQGARARCVVIEPKAGALHGIRARVAKSLQALCFEALAAQCESRDEYDLLVEELRANFIQVAMASEVAEPENDDGEERASEHQELLRDGQPDRGMHHGVVPSPVGEDRI